MVTLTTVEARRMVRSVGFWSFFRGPAKRISCQDVGYKKRRGVKDN